MYSFNPSIVTALFISEYGLSPDILKIFGSMFSSGARVVSGGWVLDVLLLFLLLSGMFLSRLSLSRLSLLLLFIEIFSSAPALEELLVIFSALPQPKIFIERIIANAARFNIFFIQLCPFISRYDPASEMVNVVSTVLALTGESPIILNISNTSVFLASFLTRLA